MGPLAGVKIIEFAGAGPAPFCGMMLADMGAEVTLVERLTDQPSDQPIDIEAAETAARTLATHAIFKRGKKSITLDLKKPAAIEIVLQLVGGADALIEGFRPGVMERLGVGPDMCLKRNAALIFGRMTGWGQHGPLAGAAGHDINYIALSGALYYSGHRNEVPFAPPTLIGDGGGGGMMLALGVVAGLLHAKQTGKGQVIDAAISDGSALLTVLLRSLHNAGQWSNTRSDNTIDGASPWYDTYECADGQYITVGAIEPKFYALLVDACGLRDDPEFADQYRKADWPGAKVKLAALFKTKTRAQWCELMEATDICFAPVLNFDEAAAHPHNQERRTFAEINGVVQPAPAPRFSETPSRVDAPPPLPGSNTLEVLQGLGYESREIQALVAEGVAGML